MSLPVSELILFLAVGRLLIYLLQHFPPAAWLAQRLGQKKFYSCDLCLGVWAYFGLAALLQFSFFDTVSSGLDFFLTGCVSSFIVHLLAIGWQIKFQEIVIR